MFLGPITSVPLMLLAVYGIGFGNEVVVPQYIKVMVTYFIICGFFCIVKVNNFLF